MDGAPVRPGALSRRQPAAVPAQDMAGPSRAATCRGVRRDAGASDAVAVCAVSLFGVRRKCARVERSDAPDDRRGCEDLPQPLTAASHGSRLDPRLAERTVGVESGGQDPHRYPSSICRGKRSYARGTGFAETESPMPAEMPLMKSLCLAASLLPLALIAGVPAAAAQPAAERVEIAANLNVLRLSDFDSTRAGIGGRVSFDVTRWMALEGEIAFFPNDRIDLPESTTFVGPFHIASDRRRT